ncbi:MAG: thiamine phosphate synthase [candidate division NC10 bacterium]
MDQLRLTLVTDRTQTRGRELVTVVGECLAAGLPAVQVREKDLGAADLALVCRRLRGLTLDTPALLIVNDRVDVALAVGADAVQRASTSLPVKDIRGLVGGQLKIGASVHSLPEAIEAEIHGADWVVFGPVNDTPSKRGFGPPLLFYVRNYLIESNHGEENTQRIPAQIFLNIIY